LKINYDIGYVASPHQHHDVIVD